MAFSCTSYNYFMILTTNLEMNYKYSTSTKASKQTKTSHTVTSLQYIKVFQLQFDFTMAGL